MKKVMLLAIVVLGGAVLLPSLGLTQEYRRVYHPSYRVMGSVAGFGIVDSDTRDGADDLSGIVPEEEASCNPSCETGYKCEDGTCKRIPITINCPDPSDLLCGA